MDQEDIEFLEIVGIALQFLNSIQQIIDEDDTLEEDLEVLMLFSTALINLTQTIINIIGEPSLTQILFPDFHGITEGGINVYAREIQNPVRFWYLTGETPQSFQFLLHETMWAISTPRKRLVQFGNHFPVGPNLTTLDVYNRLLLVLIWLRHYPRYRILSQIFGISVVTVCADIHHIIPILRFFLQREIQWYTGAEMDELHGYYPEFPNVIGSVDCSIHRIEKPIIGQGNYYRGDKGCHFFNTFAVVDPFGRFRWIEPGFVLFFLFSFIQKN